MRKALWVAVAAGAAVMASVTVTGPALAGTATPTV
jgi:hypothetical protein